VIALHSCADCGLFFIARSIDATERPARNLPLGAELLFQDIIRSFASLWLPGTPRPRPHRQRRLSCSAARRLSEFRVTDFHCAPAQFSFNSRCAIIYFLRPRSINNLTASDRLTSCSAAQRSTRAMSLPESRRPIIGRTPVAGRPRFLRLTDIDLAIIYV
jgi:hypothetical protein